MYYTFFCNLHVDNLKGPLRVHQKENIKLIHWKVVLSLMMKFRIKTEGFKTSKISFTIQICVHISIDEMISKFINQH